MAITEPFCVLGTRGKRSIGTNGSGLVISSINGQAPFFPLKSAHIAVRLTTFTFYKSDSILNRSLVNSQGTKHQRGSIRGFSPKSKNRLIFSIRNRIDASHMITLTYPRAFPFSGELVKKHWSAFRHWLLRREAEGVWILEFQKRGAPHFHIFLNKGIGKKLVAQAWYKIVGSNDERHLRAGTRVEKLRKSHAAEAYAAKYGAKMEQKSVPKGFEHVGRFWGKFGSGRKYTLFKIVGTEKIMAKIVRMFKNHSRSISQTGHKKDNGVAGWVWWDYTWTKKELFGLLGKFWAGLSAPERRGQALIFSSKGYNVRFTSNHRKPSIFLQN